MLLFYVEITLWTEPKIKIPVFSEKLFRTLTQPFTINALYRNFSYLWSLSFFPKQNANFVLFVIFNILHR